MRIPIKDRSRFLWRWRTRMITQPFTIRPADCGPIYEAFVKLKDGSSKLRRDGGVRHPEFRNICHLPDQPTVSSCLYVGSVRDNIVARMQQHLGLSTSGRTGALYLKHLLPHFPAGSVITIHVLFFDPSYTHLTERMEYVFQTRLSPMLGKRSLRDARPLE